MKSSSLWPPKPGAALWSRLTAGAQPLAPAMAWLSSASHFLISLHSHLYGNPGGIALSMNPHCIFVPKQRELNPPVAFSSPILGQEPSLLKWALYFMGLFPSSSSVLFIRVLEGCLASCSHLPQTNGKPGGKCWDINRSVSKVLPSAA